jgi:hypothetical protein
MSPISTFSETAETYADKVRVLFAASGAPSGERGGKGPTSYEDLALQAGELAPVSEQLTREAEIQLTDEDPMARIQGATSLMAKALTDLQVSAYLLQAAMDQEEEYEFAGEDAERQRGRSTLGPTDDVLDLVLGEPEAVVPAIDRGVRLPDSVSAAQRELSNTVDDAIDLISSRAAKVGQSALGGLVGMGAAELASAAGIVGLDIAEALGQAEKVTQLYVLFRSYVSGAIESIIALVGRPALEMATSKALEWVSELKEGKIFGEILLKLYGTDQTTEELHQEIDASMAELEQFLAAIQDVDKLDSAFHQQIMLAEKLLKGLRFLGAIMAVATPASKLVLAGVYMVLGVYIVVAGGDFIDAPRLQLLDRVPGVRHVVEIRLTLI